MALRRRWLRTASNGKRLQWYDGADTAIGGTGIDFGQTNSTAFLHGGGTSASPLTSTSSGKFLSYYGKVSAASGDSRTLYANLELAGTTAGAGYGDAVRSRCQVSGTGYANATGLHSTVEIKAGGTATGQSSGARVTFSAAASTRTLSGAACALQLDSDVGANNTMPTVNAYIRCSKLGSVDFDHLVALPAAAANSSIFATHTTESMSHSIRVIDNTGNVYYVMCTDTATNRGGGS